MTAVVHRVIVTFPALSPRAARRPMRLMVTSRRRGTVRAVAPMDGEARVVSA